MQGIQGFEAMQGRDFIIEAIDSAALNRGMSGAAILDDPENHVIVSGEDISLFVGDGGTTYEVHFLYKSKGHDAIRASKAAFDTMFKDGLADLIFGLTPIQLRHARMHARLVGGRSGGIRSTEHGACELFVMSREMWEGKSK